MTTTERTHGRRPAGPMAWLARHLRAVVAAAVVLGLGVTLAATVRPPRLAYTVTTLANGLRLVMLEDHSTPIVNVQVWYHVGSKDERPGRTGFAHLFEHMMFKGSKNVEPDQHTSTVSAVGGMSNAYTNEDVTVFWETMPSQYLPAALWLEADRMATLRIDKQMLDREREVVKEERRLRLENQPFGRLPEIVYGEAFAVHPYKHPTIGSMQDLQAASVDDVRDFFRTYYVPSNATVSIVGDFDTAQAIESATRYFGRIPRPDRPIAREIPAEPPVKAPRAVTVEEDWPMPVVVVAHHVPQDGHPDTYALQVASKILSDGQSARVYQSLVYEKGIALAAFGSGNVSEHPNLFFAVAMVKPGHTVDEAEKALVAELDRLRAEPVSEADLARARNQVTRDYIVGRETNQQKATALAHALVIHDDAQTADGEFDIFMKSTAADVQRVARTYFAPESRLVVRILPKASRKGAR